MSLHREWLAIDAQFETPVEAIELRPYQVDAIGRIDAAIAGGARRIMVQLATGAGKTHLASAMTARQNRPVIFTVPAIELVDQTLEKFHREGIRDVGVMQAQHHRTDTSQPIQIASVQTLMRREIPPADLVFVDEGHKIFSFYGKWFTSSAWKNVPFIGLSATPWAKGLGKLYQELIIAATTQDLIDLGYLSKFRVFAPAHPDLKGVRTVAGDYHEGDLGAAMDKAPLVADIVATWRKHGVDRTLCFAVNRLHAQHIRDKFEEAGIRCGYVDCFSTPSERMDVRSKFASGEYQIVCNVGVLTMGVDWDVRCIILARPTKSEMLFVQIVGRGLRPANGKDHCLVLDHSDTTSRLGFVTDIHHDQLDNGLSRISNARDRAKLPKECPMCACLRPPTTNVCPNCGFVAQPVNKILSVDGELQELDRNKRRIENPVEIYGQFKWIGHERNYKPGWAYHKAAEYLNCKPIGFDAAPLCPPSRTILRWEKSRRIAYAKGRAKGRSRP